MKVAVVCPYAVDEPGGVQQQATGLVEGIRKSGHQAWLVAPGMSGPPATRLLGRPTRVRANGSVAPIALRPGTVRRTRQAVQDADVVHVHEPLLAPVAPAAFLGDRPPAVGTFHADPSAMMRLGYRLASPGLRRVLSKLRAVTAVSPTAASPIEGLVEEVTSIPNGVDTGSFVMEVERYPNRVVFLGRDEPRKGLDVLLGAWPIVRSAVGDSELVVLGARRNTAPAGVYFVSAAGGLEKRRQLAMAAVYCAPNLGGESFGISLVEAMAAGCAPVVSNLEAFRRVAGDTALYVGVGDQDSLARAVIAVLRDRTGTEIRGRAARNAASGYDWRRVLPRYLDLYERAAQ